MVGAVLMRSTQVWAKRVLSCRFVFKVCSSPVRACSTRFPNFWPEESTMNSLDTILTKLKKLAPLSLAGSWDNVGLLVEPSPPKYISKMMLTNDLTAAVMEEAKDKTVDLILSYHPPIFRPLKRLTQATWKERLVIDCMESRIAVFSPHTSYDAVQGGVNDWLISAFDVKKDTVKPIQVCQEHSGGCSHVLEVDLDPARLKDIRDKALLAFLTPESRLKKNKEAFTTSAVKPSSSSTNELWRLRVECNVSELTDMIRGLNRFKCPEKYSVSPLSEIPQPSVGPGRTAELTNPISLETAISTVKSYIGVNYLNVAKAPGKEEREIETVAVCAGSGSSVLANVQADLLLTGEMSHHEVLDAIHQGQDVILCNHSNSERGYLQQLKIKLNSLLGNSIEVFISEMDADPLEIL